MDTSPCPEKTDRDGFYKKGDIKMKGKKEYIVLAFIIIAAVAYLMLHSTNRTHYQLPQITKIARKDISRIEITGPKGKLVLNRKKENWRIAPHDYPVDPEKIKRILDTVSGLKLTAMVAESKDDLRYDLGPDKRVEVKAWAGSDLKRDFWVGKPANTFRHTFVKLTGDDRVFHAEDNFRDRFDVAADTLRDKAVLSFKTGDIKTFTITKAGKSTVFSKKEATDSTEKKDEKKAGTAPSKRTQWTTADNRPADSNKVRAFLSTLSDLKCQAYLNDRKKEDLKGPIFSVSLSGSKTYRLSLYPQKKEKGDVLWPAQSSENSYPFMLADWKAKEIFKAPAGLLPDKPEPEKAPESN
ncbi:MAG: hypothetical protein DSY89_00580 [Deltaproteobacteria bacterium]|nr:MAG: hypothetical protein DSY89_00580 [Deltaproteobacteria bacterium]